MTTTAGSRSFDGEYLTFLNEMDEQSDRAVVILSVAQLDLLLRQLLERVLTPSPTSTDELFDGEGPLSRFSAKIALAHRLGIVDAGVARALHLVRRIRNAFAHEATGCTLESGGHRERVRELVAPFRSIQGFDLLVADGAAGKSGPKNEFRMAVSFMVAVLGHAPVRPERPNTTESISLVPEILLRYRVEKSQ